MASKLGELFVEIYGQNRRLFSDLQTAERGVDTSLARMQTRVRAWAGGIAATIGAAFAARELYQFGASSVKAFGEAEDALIALGGALGRTGDLTRENLDAFAAYATELQRVTVYDDEAIMGAIALGKNLGVQTAQLQDATRAAVGLAARYGLDLSTAMMLIGRASQGATSMLRRYGIVLDDSLTVQEKFNALLKIGGDSFFMAEARARSMTGRSLQLQNAWNDLKEVVGQFLAPSVKGLAAAFTDTTRTGQTLTQRMANLYTAGEKVWYLFQKIGQAVKLAFLGAVTPIIMLISAVELLSATLSGNIEKMRKAWRDMIDIFGMMRGTALDLVRPFRAKGGLSLADMAAGATAMAGGTDEEGRDTGAGGGTSAADKAVEAWSAALKRQGEISNALAVASIKARIAQMEYENQPFEARRAEARLQYAEDVTRPFLSFRQRLEQVSEGMYKFWTTIRGIDRDELTVRREGIAKWKDTAEDELQRRRDLIRFTSIEELGRSFRVRGAQAAFAVPPEIEQVNLARTSAGYLRQLVDLGQRQIATLDRKLAQLDAVLAPGYY